MVAAYQSGYNTFIPSHEASGSLIIGYSRNPRTFQLNRYMKLVPVQKSVGYYLVITAEEAARVINTNLADFVWWDGQEAPMGDDNLESFNYTKFATIRYTFPFTMGFKAVEQADWNILAVHGGIAAQKAMTARTVNFWNTLTTTSNWGSNTSTCTGLVGNALDNSTSTTLLVKKLFRNVAENILQATLGVVARESLVAVMNPHTAGIISETGELVDQFKQQPYVVDVVRMDNDRWAGRQFWGLPSELYGIPIVIEDAVRYTAKKTAPSVARATSYVVPNGAIVFMARPGGLMGMEGIPEFSTVQGFFYEEFTVEYRDDPDNRRTMGRVVEDYVPALVAPASGYYVSGCTTG